MIEVTVMTFGIARSICGERRFALQVPANTTGDGLLFILKEKYPALNALISLQLAVNEEYAASGLVLRQGDEVALIPPVSGG